MVNRAIHLKWNGLSSYIGPGDVVSGALAFWGLRGYTAAYSGACIDISDEFGTNVQTINIVSNRLDVASIATWEGSHGQSYIDKWYDQTGNGFHMIVGNQRAKLIQNSLGTYPSGRFLISHGDFYKVVTGITQAQPYFVSWVAQRTANFTTGMGVFSSAGTNGETTGFGAAVNTAKLGAYVNQNVTAADSIFHAVQANFNGDPNSDLMVDGTRTTGLSPLNEGLSGQMGLGAGPIATSAGLDGDICECGVWAGLQSSANETALDSNQRGTSGYSVSSLVQWNSADKDSNIILSGIPSTNFEAAGTSSNQCVRAACTPVSSGKIYYEGTITRCDFRISLGFCNATFALNNFPGEETNPSNGISVSQDGNFHMGAGVSAGDGGTLIATFTVGDQIDIAWDIGGQRFWARKNNGSWNTAIAGGGTQDPSSGQGGFVVNKLNAGPYYPVGHGWQGAATARLSASSWLHTRPTGFTDITGA